MENRNCRVGRLDLGYLGGCSVTINPIVHRREEKTLGDFAAWWMIPHRLCAWWCGRYEPIEDEV